MRYYEAPSNVPKVARRSGMEPVRVPGVRFRPAAVPRARMFDAARTDRLSGSWPTEPLSADQIVMRNQRVLVARSREQAANNDYMKGYLRLVGLHVVGPQGIRLQSQAMGSSGKPDEPARRAVEKAWGEWGKPANCCVRGRRSWRAIQRLAARSAAMNGEFMIRIVRGKAGGPWSFALQVLDPQRCPVALVEHDLPGGGYIRCGIEFTALGRPVAYLFSTTNEAEADRHYGQRSYVRVPAEEIVHGFLEEFEGQSRGLPWAATAMWRMSMLSGFEKAALVNARVGAAKSGFFEWREGYEPQFEGEGADEGEAREPLSMEAEPGSFEELPVGLSFKEFSPSYPAGELAPFLKAMLRGASTGLGVAYNALANDLEGVNFSSIRQGVLDEREHWQELQEWFVEALCQPVFDAWLDVALLSGRIRINDVVPVQASRRAKYAAVRWQPRRWAWIDPVKDVKAARDAQLGLMSTPGQAIREAGGDPETVFREFKGDLDAMQAAGLPDWLIAQAFQSKTAAPGGAPPAPPPADDDDEGDDDGAQADDEADEG